MDDASRLAYMESLADERGETAAGFLARARAVCTTQGIRTPRVLPDNGRPFLAHAWLAACTDFGVRHRRTRPYRPQTNGKVARFCRTTLDECWYLDSCGSDQVRAAALQAFVCSSTTQRPHLGLRGLTPAQRLALESDLVPTS